MNGPQDTRTEAARPTPLGRTGIVTTRVGFGGSRLHYLSTGAERQALLAAAWDAGIRHYDVAPSYGHGLAERVLGRFLEGRRDGAVVATKYGVPPAGWITRVPDPLVKPAIGFWAVAHKPLEKKGAPPPPLDPARLAASLEASLRRLGLDAVDLFLLHQPAPARIADPDGLARAAEDVIAAGKARAIGLAGDYEDCLATLPLVPAASVLQADESAWRAERPPEITFGALSRQPQSRRQAPVAGETARTRLAEALARRPDGVVLVSSTRPANIAALLA